MTFWEIGVGLWSTAHFVYNSGRSRGGAWEAQAPLLFLDQTEAAPDDRKNFTGDPPPPSLFQGLDDRVLLLTRASKAFACLVVLVEGKFYGFSSRKIFD